MARTVEKDFESLIQYWSSYKLPALPLDEGLRGQLKAGHKVYFATLYIWSHCHFLANKGELSLYHHKINGIDPACSHLKEAASDIGAGFFCCFHGVYKPAHMSLRSSIENFLRFIVAPFNPKALTTTKIVELFSMAKAAPPFSGINARFHSELYSIYKDLCKFSHSASSEHMSGIHAFSHFPAVDFPALSNWIKTTKAISELMMAVILVGDPKIYLKAHYKAKEIFDLLIPMQLRRRVLHAGKT